MMHLGTTALFFAAVLTALVAAIAMIDFRHHIIPDWLNLLLAAGGLTWLMVSASSSILQAVIFACLVSAGFWLIRHLFTSMRKVTGLGLGDVKMAGAAALWFSPWNLPLFLFVACASALGYIAVRALATGRLDRAERVAFGPFLGVGLWATFILERSGFATFIPAPAG